MRSIKKTTPDQNITKDPKHKLSDTPGGPATTLHWISDERVKHFTKFVENRLYAFDVLAEIFYAALTTLVRLKSATANEADPVKRLKDILSDPKTDAKRARLRLCPEWTAF